MPKLRVLDYLRWLHSFFKSLNNIIIAMCIKEKEFARTKKGLGQDNILMFHLTVLIQG